MYNNVNNRKREYIHINLYSNNVLDALIKADMHNTYLYQTHLGNKIL